MAIIEIEDRAEAIADIAAKLDAANVDYTTGEGKNFFDFSVLSDKEVLTSVVIPVGLAAVQIIIDIIQQSRPVKVSIDGNEINDVSSLKAKLEAAVKR